MATYAKTIFLTGNGSWIVPTDWNNSNFRISAIGCGGNGAAGPTAAGGTGGGGGGSGAYADKVSGTYTAGASIDYVIPAGGGAANTTFNVSDVIADFGKNASGTTGGGPGLAASSTGTNKSNGGTGGNGTVSRPGGGGGAGAAGPNGVGNNGAGGDTGSGSGGNGGSGDAGSGGAGGSGSSGGAATNGLPGTEQGGVGSGGGGGGGSDNVSFVAGANGGNYGAGPGGGGGHASAPGAAGTAAGGVIIIQYDPIAPVMPTLGDPITTGLFRSKNKSYLAMSHVGTFVQPVSLPLYVPPGFEYWPERPSTNSY